ncbi:MAG TPA: hypothetical protein VFB39_14935, partial [Solirubrobacteraceae bacterium]|nr:hypothetical protein [Solirubrobacteraceae bacterium]
MPDDELPPAASATPPPVSNASTAAAAAKVVRLNTLRPPYSLLDLRKQLAHGLRQPSNPPGV